MRLAIMLQPREANKWLIVDVVDFVEDGAGLDVEAIGVDAVIGAVDIDAVVAAGCDQANLR